MPVTHDEIVAVAESLDEDVVLVDPAPKLLVAAAEPGASTPADNRTLVTIGSANLHGLCIDPSIGTVVAFDHRRGCQPVSTSLPVFVEVLCVMMAELEKLTLAHPDPDDTPSQGRRRLAAALHRLDPAAPMGARNPIGDSSSTTCAASSS